MNDLVLKTINDYNMLKEGDRVAVGVSGGADSVALLDFLYSVKDQFKLDIVVCHVNHNLRGSESKRDENFVHSMADRLGLTFKLLSINAAQLAQQQGKSVEEASRHARYSFFKETAAGGKIATAHTATDNLETVIFNLARGTGLSGICGIPPVRDSIIRPLIACSRSDIEEYCRSRSLEYVTDSTNLTDDYTRNVIRHHITPYLLRINPSAENGAAQMCRTLRYDNDFLNKSANSAISKLGYIYKLDRLRFLKMHKSLQSRIIKRLFEENNIQPSSRLIELAFNITEEGAGQLEISKNVYIYANKEYFGILKEQNICPYFEHKITLPKLAESIKININEKKLAILLKKFNNFEKINKYLLNNSLDYDRICGVITVRQKRDGDKMSLPGRGITKSLKKLFQEKGLSAEERSTQLIVSDSLGIIWAEGFGADKRVMVTPQTQQIIQFEIQ